MNAIVCPVHGPGYTRCLGCLAEAQLATQHIELGAIDVPAVKQTTDMRRYWLERYTLADIEYLAESAGLIEAAA